MERPNKMVYQKIDLSKVGPKAIPPGQLKKEVEKAGGSIYYPQEALTIYLDPEGVLKSKDHNFTVEDEVKLKNETARNVVLTHKGYHPAKVPHPMLTHFIKRGK
jgi:hypothetical protein